MKFMTVLIWMQNIPQKKVEIADGVEYMARKLSYITLNNRKENFSIKPTGRLINPARIELGEIE